MAIHRTIIEIHLGIQRQNLTAFGHHEGIDFCERTIGLYICTVKGGYKTNPLFELIAFKPQTECEMPRLKGLKSHAGMNDLFENFFRRRRSHLFNIHPTRTGSHNDQTRLRAVQHNTQVQFSVNIRRIFHPNRFDLLPFSTRLRSNELHANNF